VTIYQKNKKGKRKSEREHYKVSTEKEKTKQKPPTSHYFFPEHEKKMDSFP
jgi:hypothetical protein